MRHMVPRDTDSMDLHWTYLGFTADTPEMRRRSLKQAKLVGPGGYISMEDGCIGGFVQRATATGPDEASVIHVGGETAELQPTRLTEAAVRGFRQTCRGCMGI